eukprot:m.36951 g.36951  ORF g.36951 m.36951 type:complete len:572 (+) comp17529_c0_seq1:497-2212(+)
MGDWSRLAGNSDKRKRRTSESNANPFQCHLAKAHSQTSYPTRAGDFLVGTTIDTNPKSDKVISDTTNSNDTVITAENTSTDNDDNTNRLAQKSDLNSSEISAPPKRSNSKLRNESFSALLGVLNQPTSQPMPKRQRYIKPKPQNEALSADLQSDFDFDLDDDGSKITSNPNESDDKTTTTKANTEIPMDWSIKHHLRFTSEASFDWTKRMKGTDKAHGLTHFVRSNHRTSVKSDLPAANLSSTFHNAGLYYVHPGQPWARAFRDKMSMYIDESKVDAEELAYLDLVNSEWTAAFTSAYQSLQNNLCPYFYVSSNKFVVLFRARGIGGADEVSAIISRSSRGLRASLEREEVPFEIPLVPEYAAQRLGRAQAEAQLAKLEEDETGPYKLQTKISAELSSSRHDGSYKSLLTFKGVHALFEYLLNRKYARQSSIRLLEPPTLYSCAEFLNCTLKSMKVKFCGTISRKKKISGRSNASETYHCLELEGVCLPHSFTKLYNAFNVSQDQSFEVVVLKNNQSTGALNYHSDDITTSSNLETDDTSEFYKASTLGTSSFSKISIDGGEPLFTSKQAQ